MKYDNIFLDAAKNDGEIFKPKKTNVSALKRIFRSLKKNGVLGSVRCAINIIRHFGKDVFSAEIPYVVKSGSKSDSMGKIAVQIHLFYPDVSSEIIKNLNLIPYPFDCYISTDTNEKKCEIKKIFSEECIAEKIVCEVFENRGRDVAPLVLQMADRIDNYDYICHIHSKKSNEQHFGDSWRRYLYRHLFGSAENICAILKLLNENNNLGLVFPENYPLLKKHLNFKGNLGAVLRLGKRLKINRSNIVEDFPAGNMFWAKVCAVKDIFKLNLIASDFPKEKGQIDSTLAHAIERIWVSLANKNGYSHLKVINNTKRHFEGNTKNRIAIISVNGEMDSTHDKLIESFNPFCDRVVLSKDFDASEISNYEEIILVDESLFGPFFNIESILCDFKDKKCDFYGLFYSKDEIGDYISSDFMILSGKAKELYINNIEQIKTNKRHLFDVLKNKQCKGDVLLRESRFFDEKLGMAGAEVLNPYDMLILGSPFLLKKSLNSAEKPEINKLKNFISEL